ncbi:MAG TPA: methylmalonyl-CoA mutase family protein [Acidimicrobiales bacterium]|jgi:methylmalonyl-CoA mutase N-terminal domain/subunit|nr:methylmalonyl-CoA mutase family protein [Acidimicrobiales bacterium]
MTSDPAERPPSELEAALDEWTARHEARLAPGDVGSATLSGLAVRALYTPLDAPRTEAEYLERLGFPGEPPFTRGVAPGMYRERLWVMGQYSGVASASETNLRIRSLLEQGQRGFSVALDLPTQNGLDSDHPLSQGEVGRVGVPIDTLADMETMLEGIPLDKVAQIRTTANAIGPIAVALFVAAAESLGYPPDSFRLLLQNDVLKEYLARGTYVFPPRPALRFAVDVVEYCATHLPTWEPIEFCGYHIRDSGSTAVQEVAIAFANGIEYIEAALSRGLDIDAFAPSIYLFFSSHLDVFEEVAKFRAARRMWYKLLKLRFGAKRAESLRANIFCYTLGSPQTAQEPLNNVVRIAYQTMAAVLGGVQTLATSSFDEALGLPSDDAVRVALRTQQILAYETGVARAADPLGGSYLVESLTDEFEAAAWDYLGKIKAEGGALAALESGWLHAELDAQAYTHQVAVDRGDHVVVGVNRFQVDTPRFATHAPTANSTTEREQIERLGAVKRARNAEQVRRSLEELDAVAASGANTIPTLLHAVRAYATVGEICDVLGRRWGTFDDHHR